MKRRILQIAAAALLVATLTTALEWIRSQWRSDELRFGSAWPEQAVPTGTIQWSFVSDDGLVSVTRLRNATASTVVVQKTPSPRLSFRSGKAGLHSASGSFRFYSGSQASRGFYTQTYYRLVAPWWIVVASWGTAFALVCRALIRFRQRSGAGFCCRCGYDLRATPNQCPECGTVQEQAPRPLRNQPMQLNRKR